MRKLLLVLAIAAVGFEPFGWESHTRTMRCTGYCPCSICTNGEGVTASGRSAYTDGVAVDPDVVHLGARLDIPGYGSWKLADDTGRVIKGNRLDIRFQQHSDAQDFGVKYLQVRVWSRRH